VLQGKGLVAALKAKGTFSKHPVVAELNGAPTDNNATLFAKGYNSVLAPLYKNGTFVKGPNQSVTNWNNQVALTDFQAMLAKTNNKINAVLAANDGLAGAVVSALKSAKLSPIPVTGQDATPGGLQYILAGWQSGTVYKPVPVEAAAAAKVAIDLIKGKPVKTNSVTNNGSRKVLSVLETPIWVTKANHNLLFTSGFLKEPGLRRPVQALRAGGLGTTAGGVTRAPPSFIFTKKCPPPRSRASRDLGRSAVEALRESISRSGPARSWLLSATWASRR
jgi:D-xylose transport system substrate-binding protein